MDRTAQKKYDNANMTKLCFAYKKDFVEEYKNACSVLGISQSQDIKKAMEKTIKRATKK